jgi:hypothetical protein
MGIWELPNIGDYWKLVCWGSCKWQCSICEHEVVVRGLYNPSGMETISRNSASGGQSRVRERIIWKRRRNTDEEDAAPAYVCWHCAPALPRNQLAQVHTWYYTARERWQQIRRNLGAILALLRDA